MNTQRAVSLLLRLGVAFAFLFPAINSFFEPYTWVGYFPSLLQEAFPDSVLIYGFGIVEMAIGLWILSGRRIFIPSIAATLILLLIVLLNFHDFQTLFRDLSIAAMSLALVIIYRPHRVKKEGISS